MPNFGVSYRNHVLDKIIEQEYHQWLWSLPTDERIVTQYGGNGIEHSYPEQVLIPLPKGLGFIAPASRSLSAVVRSSAQKAAFLKGLAATGKYAKWMKQWTDNGKNPPGYDVDHIVPLSIGGRDIPANMRLNLRANHRLHHKFYRPWR